jgi:hypothetical protein
MREKIYIGLIVLLIVILVVFVILTQEERKDLIEVSQCSKPKGEYAVDAGYESSDPVNTCGTNGTSVCSFPVNNLQDAFNVCNSNADKCSRFMYNEQSKIMTFIGDTPSMKLNPVTNIYIRQGGVIS